MQQDEHRTVLGAHSAEDLRRITLWLDCNSTFYGAYHDTEKQARGVRVVSTLE